MARKLSLPACNCCKPECRCSRSRRTRKSEAGSRKNQERIGFEKAHEGICATDIEACGRFAENDIGAGAGDTTSSVGNIGGRKLPRRSPRKIQCALSLQTRRCRRRGQ